MPSVQIQIRKAIEADFDTITKIYNHYIRTNIATFEEQEVTTSEMISRKKILTENNRLPYLVAILNHKVVGYAYAGPLKPRSAYRFAVENTIYISPEHSRRGIGRILLQATIDALRERGVKTILPCISIPPDQKIEDSPSCALHIAMGCRVVGRWEKVGVKFGKWIDVAWLQLDLEERGTLLEESQSSGGWKSTVSI
jgi:L-amino acid N-acyltransferase YncA